MKSCCCGLSLQFHQKEPSYVEMAFILPRGSSVGLYARKNAIPTLTLNDIRDVLSGFRATTSDDTRQSRSIVSFFSVQKAITKDDFSGKGHLAGNLRILNLAI
jgi:hypothetical protein